jgi:hypothetical protein
VGGRERVEGGGLRPKGVKVGWFAYPIEYRAEIKEGDQEYYGRQFEKDRILVSTKFGEAIERESLLHELIHAISADRGLGLKESQVLNMANGLFDSLANKPAADWIFRGK